MNLTKYEFGDHVAVLITDDDVRPPPSLVVTKKNGFGKGITEIRVKKSKETKDVVKRLGELDKVQLEFLGHTEREELKFWLEKAIAQINVEPEMQIAGSSK